MVQYGTKVKNPVRRFGSGYTPCVDCGKYYTRLGISRHWPKCPKRPAPLAPGLYTATVDTVSVRKGVVRVTFKDIK
jgi:hypothetical protein